MSDQERNHPAARARVGFIGFGEVAAVFSEALARGGAEVLAFDSLGGQPDGMTELAKRDRTGRVRWVGLADLVDGCDWVFSTVTTRAAESAARSFAQQRAGGKTYLDFNATSPAVKREIAGIIAPTGAQFVEGAILSAVGVTGARTRILIGDTRGPGFAEELGRLGLNAVFYSRDIGRASAFKLLRSIFSKGLEALLLEFLVAGRRAGVEQDLWHEVVELFAGNTFERVAANWIETHPAAHERRYHEVVQMVAEMRALGVEPLMSAATEAFFNRSRGFDWKEGFGEKPPAREDVIAAIERATRPVAPPNPPVHRADRSIS